MCDCCGMMDKIMQGDLFAKKPQLRLPSGETKYNTCIGSFCTLIFWAAIGAFIYFDVTKLAELD